MTAYSVAASFSFMPSLGGLFQALAHQLLAVESSLPVAAEALDEFRIFGLLLPVEILQLAADFDHARKTRAVFGAELRLFLLQVAAARVNLLAEARWQSWRLSACRRGSEAITISGSPCEAARYSASPRMRSVVAATSWRPSSSISSSAAAVLGFAWLAVGLHLRRAHDAVLRLRKSARRC